MPITPYKCSECGGRGMLMVRRAVAELTSAEGTLESKPCSACGGTGYGWPATAKDLRAYPTEPLRAMGDLFELAKQVASHTSRPRAKTVTTTTVQVSSGFLSRKTKPYVITDEVEKDYWVLLTKKGYMKRERGSVEHGSALEEEVEKETILCLGANGSFKSMTRSKESVLWSDYRYEDLGWSESVRPLKNLDHFLIEFDFDGYAAASSPGYWSENTSVVGDMDFYIDRDAYTRFRRLHPKGMGLYSALEDML